MKTQNGILKDSCADLPANRLNHLEFLKKLKATSSLFLFYPILKRFVRVKESATCEICRNKSFNDKYRPFSRNLSFFNNFCVFDKIGSI